MIEQHVTRTVHLERTSEADQVPAAWAAAEITRALASLSATERESAMLTGWRDSAVLYVHRRTDLEVAQDRLAVLLSALRMGEASGLTSEQIAEALKQAGG